MVILLDKSRAGFTMSSSAIIDSRTRKLATREHLRETVSKRLENFCPQVELRSRVKSPSLSATATILLIGRIFRSITLAFEDPHPPSSRRYGYYATLTRSKAEAGLKSESSWMVAWLVMDIHEVLVENTRGCPGTYLVRVVGQM